jgi:transposase-like protein
VGENKMAIKESYEEGLCPYCGSEGIENDGYIDNYDDYEEQEWHCVDCKRVFNIVLSIERAYTYDHTEYEEIPLDKRTLFDKP